MASLRWHYALSQVKANELWHIFDCSATHCALSAVCFRCRAVISRTCSLATFTARPSFGRNWILDLKYEVELFTSLLRWLASHRGLQRELADFLVFLVYHMYCVHRPVQRSVPPLKKLCNTDKRARLHSSGRCYSQLLIYQHPSIRTISRIYYTCMDMCSK